MPKLTMAQALVRSASARRRRRAAVRRRRAIFGHGNVAALGEAGGARHVADAGAHNEQAMAHAAIALPRRAAGAA